jgi:hypothetical protein
LQKLLEIQLTLLGFTTGKPYVFEGNNGKRIATDQYAIAQHGSVKKDYSFLQAVIGRKQRQDPNPDIPPAQVQ